MNCPPEAGPLCLPIYFFRITQVDRNEGKTAETVEDSIISVFPIDNLWVNKY
jgi:hypothetical protein